jgi:lipopolysaccharide export system permease protein
MNRLEKYIISNLSSLFLSIFSALFAIASVIFLIKLATYTAVIQLSILEMTKLYLFILPEILFYTLPISFFIAATLSLYRLSNDNEIVVIFALGIHPRFILKTLFKPALLLSMLLFFNYLVLFPHTTVLSSNFLYYKKSEAKFNLSASEFGHKFGDWLLYLSSSDGNGTYGDVFLFNKNKKEEILISAKNAQVINDSGILRLKLTQGEGYSYSKESFSQINFETMYINDTMSTKIIQYRDAIDYWRSDEKKKKKRAMLITNTLLSLFPLISLFLVVSLGVIHVRHKQSMVYLYLFLAILMFYGATLGLQKALVYYTIPVVLFVWLSVTYIIYRKTILSRF